MPSLRDQLVQTANSYITGFNTNTAEGIIASRTADCKQIILPASCPPPWKNPPRSNAEYQAFILPGFKHLRNLNIFIADGEDMIVDDVSRKVVLPLQATGETDHGPYTNEYMMVLKMTEDGTQIKEVVEFIDSATVRDLAASMASQIKEAYGTGEEQKGV
jgi:hypothetical protein